MLLDLPWELTREILLLLPRDNILIACATNKYIKGMNLNSWLAPCKLLNIHVRQSGRVRDDHLQWLRRWSISSAEFLNVSPGQWMTRYIMADVEELMGCGCPSDYPQHYYKEPSEFKIRARRVSHNKEYRILRLTPTIKVGRYHRIFESETLRALIG